MKYGEVCLIEYPFTDGSDAKLRPVVVVSSNNFNGGADVVVLPISSSVDPGDKYSVLIDKSSAHFKQAGLRVSSSVKCTKPMTVAKRLMKKRLGSLAEAILSDVRTIIQDLFSIKN